VLAPDHGLLGADGPPATLAGILGAVSDTEPGLRAWLVLALALLCAALTSAAPAAAAPAPAEVADALSDRWAALQGPDAVFPDSIRPGSHSYGRYGEAGMGYGLMLAGVRRSRPDLVEAGARAQVYAAEHAPDRGSVFESMMMASAYNLLRTRAPATPTFAARREVWENYLRDIKPLFDAGIAAPYLSSNKYLVEAVLELELDRSGLRSRVPGAVLQAPGSGRRRALHIINKLVPARVRMLQGHAGGHRTTALSDRYAEPLAYHNLGIAFLARAIDLAGRGASTPARRGLRIGVRTVWGFQAPDGDVAYFGRSQGQSWALAFTTFAAVRAAGAACDSQARAYRAVAQRAMDRIAARHPIRATGMAIVPSADGPRTVAAIDSYASDVVYNGLTLTALGWAADGSAPAPRCRSGRLLSDKPIATAVYPFESSRFATARRGRVWLAVKQYSKERDARAAFGLRALKYRADDGGWIDLVPASPAAVGNPVDKLGPALILHSGAIAWPKGSHTLLRNGQIVVRGGWVSASGRWVRRKVNFRFRATRRGVRMVVPTKPGDRLVYSALSAGRPQPVRRGVRSPVATTRASVRTQVGVQGPFASSSSLDVWRADLRVRATGHQVSFETRAG
jgi:hypothetical protein